MTAAPCSVALTSTWHNSDAVIRRVRSERPCGSTSKHPRKWSLQEGRADLPRPTCSEAGYRPGASSSGSSFNSKTRSELSASTKTHLATALGIVAARHGQLPAELAKLRRYGLIIIDEVRLPFLNTNGYEDRNVVERSFALNKQWRRIATRYNKLAITYRAAAVLHACIT